MERTLLESSSSDGLLALLAVCDSWAYIPSDVEHDAEQGTDGMGLPTWETSPSAIVAFHLAIHVRCQSGLELVMVVADGQ